MLNKPLRGLAVCMVAAVLSGAAFATRVPSLHEVYQAVAAGRYAQAQAMMDQVLKAHPASAKAHYVEAELLAKQGQYRKSETELATAEHLNPGLPFSTPNSVAELKARLRSSHGPQPITGGGAFPWGLVMLGVGTLILIGLVMRALAVRSAATAYGFSPQPGAGNGAAGAGAIASPAGGGLGSSLATGVAVGAGLVAGEALAHHFLDGNNTANNFATPVADTRLPSTNDGAGGNDFGISDNSSWDDSTDLGDSLTDDADDWS